MPQVTIYDKTGKNVGSLDLKKEVFEVPVKECHLHMAVKRQLNNKRAGTAHTKTRGEVSGGGKKPWRQKGTGRARHGSIRSPIWKGGGTTFGPRMRDYATAMPRKMRRLALREALSAKVKAGQLLVLEKIAMDAISTRTFAAMMKDLKLEGKTLFIVKEIDEIVEKSGRNIPGVRIVKPEGINVYDTLYFDNLVFEKEALKHVEEVLS
ncbi:MAG: 50S ribosomal protein L4 [Candidatus Eremiobacteraeota bacterium]|nr:50S ribosomal protein L4 [Candidatus Eremiobacteraeota bacterium]